MGLKAGDVVVLKSGGQPLTVAEVHDDMAACVWIGEEGDLFRETLPSLVLELAHFETLDDEEDDEDSDGDEDKEEEDEDEHGEDEDHHDKKAEVA